jgi:hypothetical protein
VAAVSEHQDEEMAVLGKAMDIARSLGGEEAARRVSLMTPADVKRYVERNTLEGE